MLYALLLHALKTGVCLAVFYLFFKLLLARETFHRLNRILILAATVASFVLPLCVITVYREAPAISLPEALPAAAGAVEATGAEAAGRWRLLAGAVLLAGAAATLALTIRSLAGVLRIVRSGERRRLDDGSLLVVVEEAITPFSWGGHVVIGRRDLAENGAAILAHERAHVRLRHSWDLLLTDLAGCLQWFNPAMWLLRSELRAIHEYEADEAVLDSGVDARQYQLLLIKKAAGGRWYSVANSFNHSKLKNRITMMLQKRSSRWAAAKALLTLPLAAAALGAFAQTAYVVPDDKDTQKTTKIVVVGGDSSKISVRGVDQTSGLKPLYIVDGKEVEQIGDLDHTRIANISVLKDAAAVERYGERAKDGVIVITTRSGDEAAAGSSVSVSTSTSEGASEKIVIGTAADTKTVTTTTVTSASDSGESKTSVSENIRITGNITAIPKEKWKSEDVLVYIDGKKASAKKLEKLDPSRIGSIVVRKDDKVVEQYGKEASGGVIFIETK